MSDLPSFLSAPRNSADRLMLSGWQTLTSILYVVPLPLALRTRSDTDRNQSDCPGQHITLGTGASRVDL